MMKLEKTALVATGTTLRTTGPVPMDSRQGTSLVWNCVTRLNRDDELGTDPMAVDGKRERGSGKREESRE